VVGFHPQGNTHQIEITAATRDAYDYNAAVTAVADFHHTCRRHRLDQNKAVFALFWSFVSRMLSLHGLSIVDIPGKAKDWGLEGGDLCHVRASDLRVYTALVCESIVRCSPKVKQQLGQFYHKELSAEE
jgi:hypothetical protein